MSIDRQIAQWVSQHRSPAGIDAAQVASWVGNEPTVLLAGLLLVGWLWFRGARRDAVGAFLGLGGAAALTLVLKEVVQRSRPGPQFRWGPPDPTWSFPSGHSLHIAALAVLVIGLVQMPRPDAVGGRGRRVLVSAALFVVLAVGCSRVYLGLHWATDVLAGWLLGSGWAALVVWCLRRPRAANPRSPHPAGRAGAISVGGTRGPGGRGDRRQLMGTGSTLRPPLGTVGA